jgi:ABC-type antimicrobial peptide transport system permease subunit
VPEQAASVALDAVMTLDARLVGTLARPRLYALVLAGFAGFALAIAAVGLFGVLSYSVAQRSREMAIRAALGARPSDLVRLVLREGLVITAAGAAAGLWIASLLARSLTAFLFGIRPHDPLTFVGVPVLLIAIAALACSVPARRAVKESIIAHP